MIPALLAHTVHQALAYKPRPPTAQAAANPADDGSGKLTNPGAGRSIASDIGQLTGDTLSLLGLGIPATANAGGMTQAAQAYASAGKL